jgi:hypothetical protein
MTTFVRNVAAACAGAALVMLARAQLQAQIEPETLQHQHPANAGGPPVTLASLLREALENNLDLVALRDRIDVARHPMRLTTTCSHSQTGTNLRACERDPEATR